MAVAERELLQHALPTEQLQRQEGKLSDERVGNLLCAFGNHESKALTLSLMRPRRVYRSGKLSNMLIELQGDNPGWMIADQTVFSYFINSFQPNELVTLQREDGERVVFGFGITEYGNTIGIPLAGLLLDFSLRYREVALQNLLGTTNSSGDKSSPTARLQIFREIARANGIQLREADIVEALGEEYAYVGTHLRSLRDHSVLNYETPQPGEPISLYRFLPETPKREPRPYPRKTWRMKEVTTTILDICKSRQHEFLTIQEVGQAFLERRLGYEGVNLSQLHYLVSAVLSDLTSQGFLAQGKFHVHKHSQISTTKDQRDAIEDFIHLIDRFQKQDKVFLREGREKAETILRDPEKVSFLMRKAHGASRRANAHPQEDTKAHILDLVQRYPGITNRQLQVALQERGIRLGRNRVQRFSGLLWKEAKIEAQSKKTVLRFYPSQAPISAHIP